MSQKATFSLSQMNNAELDQTLSWRELEIADTELWAKWKGKTHFSRNEKRTFLATTTCAFTLLAAHLTCSI